MRSFLMAVYSIVTPELAQTLFDKLELGTLTHLQGCQGGIENTNYFASSARGDFVLTIFERLSFEQLPFYLHLMKHLAGKGIPVPDPQADPQGEILHTLLGKPATLVNKLPGKSQLAPQVQHCAAVGAMLARMHLAAQDLPRQQANLRGLAWVKETLPSIVPFLQPAQTALLARAVAEQEALQQTAAYASLPSGAIHADLFRDNVMFVGDELTGFFDFYFAGIDAFVFDIAICLNDWCIDHATGATEPTRLAAFVDAYNAVRPLSATEREMLPAMRRAGALRFWTSRLWDFHLPRDAAMLQAHDPSHFERVLMQLEPH